MGSDDMGWDQGSQNDGIHGHHLLSSRDCIPVLVYVNGCQGAPITQVTLSESRLELCDTVVLQVPKDEDGL